MGAQYEGRVERMVVPRGAAIPTTGWTAMEKAVLEARVAALEAMGLVDLADVEAAGLSTGDVFVWDGGRFVRTPLPGAAAWGSVTGAIADQADLAAALAGKAEAGHTHGLPIVSRHTYGATASTPDLSSGTRQLVSATVGPFGVGEPTLVEVTGHVHAQGLTTGGSGGHIHIAIDGSDSSSAVLAGVEPLKWEHGVNTTHPWDHSVTITRLAAGTAAQTAANRTISMSLERASGTFQIISAWIRVRRTVQS